MATHDYDEKRSFIRMQLETELRFLVLNDTAPQHYGFSHDLSATGLLMSSDFSPDEGARIQVEIATQSERFEPFTAFGNVVRVQPNSLGKAAYLISVEFDTAE